MASPAVAPPLGVEEGLSAHIAGLVRQQVDAELAARLSTPHGTPTRGGVATGSVGGAASEVKRLRGDTAALHARVRELEQAQVAADGALALERRQQSAAVAAARADADQRSLARVQRLEDECAQLRAEVGSLQLERARLSRVCGDAVAAADGLREELARAKEETAAALELSLARLQQPVVPLEQYQQALAVAEQYAAALRGHGPPPEAAFDRVYQAGADPSMPAAAATAAAARSPSTARADPSAPAARSCSAATSSAWWGRPAATSPPPQAAEAPSAEYQSSPAAPLVSPQSSAAGPPEPAPSDSAAQTAHSPVAAFDRSPSPRPRPVKVLTCPTVDSASSPDNWAGAVAPPQSLRIAAGWWAPVWRSAPEARPPVRTLAPRRTRTYPPVVLAGAAAERGLQSPTRSVPYGLPGPTVPGSWEAMLEDGRLFKLQKVLEGPDSGRTALLFYNGTRDTHFTVQYVFGPQSELQVGGSHVEVDDESMTYTCGVGPGETRSFVHGHINGYRMTVKYGPVGPEQLAATARQYDGLVTQQLAALKNAAQERGVDLRSDVDVAKMCADLDIQYVDWRFPPRPTTLSRPWEGRFTAWPWMRPRDYLTSEVGGAAAVFAADGDPGTHRDAVQPNDLMPGVFGDLWLSSAAAALAEHPRLLRRLFLRAPDSRCGAHALRISKHGWWQTVVVDDYLPSRGRMPACVSNIREPGELWGAVLEKAVAKVHGSYQALRNGDSVEALQDLTGFPVERFDWHDVNLFGRLEKLMDPVYGGADFVPVLCTAPGKRDVDSAGGPDADSSEAAGTAHLPAGCAFAVLAVRRCRSSSTPGGLRMLRLRDALLPPSCEGVARWRGRWSAADPAWVQLPEVAEQLAAERGESDSSFWMEWSDAHKVFSGGGCCLATPDWQDFRIASEFRSGSPSHMLEVWPYAPAECIVGLHQRDRRGLEPTDPDRTYAAYAVSVLEPVPGRGWAVTSSSCGGAYWCGRDVYLHARFTVAAERRPCYVVWQCSDPELTKQVVVSVRASEKFANLVLKQPDDGSLAALNTHPLGKGFDGPNCPAVPARVQTNGREETLSELSMGHMPAWSGGWD
eukprot:TRINITY_DN2406_c2_g4_i1.p1 TRINITY_DN2406_c2_g4~~TRINITY_DN2406_c2_g4_i1.p1  ORF type:complete len:1094 (+),score=345.69 TRINITY_DN2406_c2_g4_i1:41-3283(+)